MTTGHRPPIERFDIGPLDVEDFAGHLATLLELGLFEAHHGQIGLEGDEESLDLLIIAGGGVVGVESEVFEEGCALAVGSGGLDEISGFEEVVPLVLVRDRACD